MQKNILFFIFLITTAYLYFFTSSIPFFWDEHQFNELQANKTVTSLLKSTFRLGAEDRFVHSDLWLQRLLRSDRPVYGLFLKTLLFFFGYNFELYRLIKAINFGIFCLLIYLISSFVFVKRFDRLFVTGLISFSFPLYMHALLFTTSFTLAESFKLTAILIFLKDFFILSTPLNQFIIFLASLLAVRAYEPSYSIAGILFLFILFSDRSRFKKYFFLLILLIAINFPMNVFTQISVHDVSPTLWSANKILFGFTSTDIFSPFFNYNDLYYKPFISIITFFGFWSIIISLLIIILKKFHHEKHARPTAQSLLSVDRKKILLFFFIWLLCEIPAIIFIKEHAIRYTSAFLIPFYFLYMILVSHARESFKDFRKRLLYFFVICFTCIILINIFYTTAFRIGWGSSFIGKEKVITFFNSKASERPIVFYYTNTVADEYTAINTTNNLYTLRHDIIYNRIKNETNFINELKPFATKSPVYIIKRTTPQGRQSFPAFDFSDKKHYKNIAEFDGTSDSLFDKSLFLIKIIFGLNIKTTTFIIYRFIP